MKFERICRVLSLTILPDCGCLFAGIQTSRPQQKEIVPVGCFANVRSDGEHAEGYSAKFGVGFAK
jgi:hypothetical protein